MSVILALPRLHDAVVARFALDAAVADPPVTAPEQPFGWRPVAQQPHGHRIVWVPGDDSNGDLGELGPAKYPGGLPRTLGTLGELFTVYLEAHDITAPENERSQYIASRLLFDAWVRAVHLAASGTFSIVSANWVDSKKERRFGATIRVVAMIEAAIADSAAAIASLTDARALLDVALLDHEEQIEAGDAPPAVVAATTEPLDELSGLDPIDGVTVSAGDRVLVKDEPEITAELNGIWIVDALAWSRADDELEHGFFVHVAGGDENGDSGWELDTADPIVVDTTPLSFVRVSP
jgi:hypothetical protein